MLGVLAASYLLGVDAARRPASLLDWAANRFSWADSYHYLRIAEVGYLPPGLPCCDQAFFPGYPALIRLLTPVTGDATRAGLLISVAAAAAAAVLLHRLALLETGDAVVAVLAVGYLAAAPYGIFLTAVFTEALFLALALGAWVAGRRGRWWLAGTLAAFAAAVRVNGVFLAAGLMVMYALALRRPDRSWSRPRADVLALASPALVVAGFLAYLHARTGSWTAWTDAQATGWDRRGAWPWQGPVAGWRALTVAATPDLLWARIADLVAVVAGLALLVLLAARRRWPELTYVGLSLAVLVSSTTVQSSARYALAWFPGYLVLAELTAPAGRRALAGGLLAAGVALQVALSLALAAHLWVG